jgi:D-aminopeptidase
VAAPVELTVAFIHSQLADRAALLPLARRDGRRVSVTAESMPVAYCLFRTLMNLT